MAAGSSIIDHGTCSDSGSLACWASFDSGSPRTGTESSGVHTPSAVFQSGFAHSIGNSASLIVDSLHFFGVPYHITFIVPTHHV